MNYGYELWTKSFTFAKQLKRKSSNCQIKYVLHKQTIGYLCQPSLGAVIPQQVQPASRPQLDHYGLLQGSRAEQGRDGGRFQAHQGAHRVAARPCEPQRGAALQPHRREHRQVDMRPTARMLSCRCAGERREYGYV